MDDSKGETAPALGISINAQVGPRRQITLQTFIDRDASGIDIDILLDKMNDSMDRQEAFFALEDAQNQLDVDTNVLTNVTNRLAAVEDNIRLKAASETGRRNPVKLSSQEEMQKKQAHDSLAEAQKRVEIDKAIVARLKKKAGNRDGVNSPADR